MILRWYVLKKESYFKLSLVKHYLWTNRFISRFTPAGKQNRSNGTYVWIVEARKTHDGGWIFKEFGRKILCPVEIAYIDTPWRCHPRVHDPQILGIPLIFSYA